MATNGFAAAPCISCSGVGDLAEKVFQLLKVLALWTSEVLDQLREVDHGLLPGRFLGFRKKHYETFLTVRM